MRQRSLRKKGGNVSKFGLQRGATSAKGKAKPRQRPRAAEPASQEGQKIPRPA